MSPNLPTTLRLVLLGLALVLPLVSLVGLGSFWLWQNGYLIAWALAACVFTLSIYGFELWMLHGRRRNQAPDIAGAVGGSAAKGPANRSVIKERTGTDIGTDIGSSNGADQEVPIDQIHRSSASASEDDGTDTDIDPRWSEAERRAWATVQTFSAGIDPETIDSRKAVLDLGRDVVTLVAQSLHPDQRDPVLHFTVPEGLVLIEQVARRLRPLIEQSVPLGDQVTIGQLMRLYQWRSVIAVASKGYDLWRLIRVMNPVTAATQEVREQVTKKIYDWGREAAARKLLHRYIEEVARAAIDLYAGRLKVSADQLEEHLTAQSANDLQQVEQNLSEPLRVLIGGQIGAGKSSLINGLSDQLSAVVDTLPGAPDVTTHLLHKDGVPVMLAIDLPGLDSQAQISQLLDQHSQNCDLILWVVAADRADRDLDLRALTALSASFAAEPDRVWPPVLLVMSHIDRLRPLRDWHPPYDWEGGADTKSRSIKAAQEAICADLDVKCGDVIPAFLGRSQGGTALLPYNIDGVWGRIAQMLPEAKSVRLSRLLKDATPAFSWRRLGAQTLAGARGVKKNLWK